MSSLVATGPPLATPGTGGVGQPARLYVKGAAELLLDSCRLQVSHLCCCHMVWYLVSSWWPWGLLLQFCLSTSCQEVQDGTRVHWVVPLGTPGMGCVGQPARLYVKGAAELLLDSCRLQVSHLCCFHMVWYFVASRWPWGLLLQLCSCQAVQDGIE
jgi:hypothetical protein